MKKNVRYTKLLLTVFFIFLSFSAHGTEISNCEDLTKLEEHPEREFQVTDNIYCEGNSFEPIGSIQKPFKGSIDGGGHIIDGIYVSGEEKAGMFTKLENASVKELGLRVHVESGETTGGFAAISENTTFEETYTMSEITRKDKIREETVAGGFVGNSSRTEFINSFTTGQIMGFDVAGGFSGVSKSSVIEKSYSSINKIYIGYAGGFIGRSSKDTANLSFFSGDINSERTKGFTGEESKDIEIKDSFYYIGNRRTTHDSNNSVDNPEYFYNMSNSPMKHWGNQWSEFCSYESYQNPNKGYPALEISFISSPMECIDYGFNRFPGPYLKPYELSKDHLINFRDMDPESSKIPLPNFLIRFLEVVFWR